MIGLAGPQHYLLGLKNGATHLCEIETNQFVRELQTFGNKLITSAYNSDTQFLAVGLDNQKVCVFDQNSGEVFTLISIVEVQDDITALFWHNQHSLVVGQIEGYCDMIDCTAVKCEVFYSANIPLLGDVYSIDHTPTQNLVVVGCINGVFFVELSEEGFSPKGQQYQLEGVVTYQVSQTGDGNYLAVTTTVGENESHDTVNVVMFRQDQQSQGQLVSLLKI